MNDNIETLTKSLTDAGKIIEAGWIGLKHASLNENASQIQINEMRFAFFAGAQHLFSSIMCILDPGQEITEKDLNRISLIDEELKKFITTYMMNNLPVKNNNTH